MDAVVPLVAVDAAGGTVVPADLDRHRPAVCRLLDSVPAALADPVRVERAKARPAPDLSENPAGCVLCGTDGDGVGGAAARAGESAGSAGRWRDGRPGAARAGGKEDATDDEEECGSGPADRAHDRATVAPRRRFPDVAGVQRPRGHTGIAGSSVVPIVGRSAQSA